MSLDSVALREMGYEMLPVVVEKQVADAFMAKYGDGWAKVLIDFVKREASQ